MSGATVGHYIDLLVDLLLVRRLPPRVANVGKRLVRAPKVYVRDSGLLHALLGLADKEAVLRAPDPRRELGGDGGREPDRRERRAGRGELLPHRRRRRGRPGPALGGRTRVGGGGEAQLAPKLERGLRSALADIEPERRFVVYPGSEQYGLGDGVEAIDLGHLCAEIARRGKGRVVST